MHQLDYFDKEYNQQNICQQIVGNSNKKIRKEHWVWLLKKTQFFDVSFIFGSNDIKSRYFKVVFLMLSSEDNSATIKYYLRI